MAEAIVLPSAVISTLARQSAIKAVKERLRAQGVRLSHVSARDIHLWADAYLEANRQALIEQAITTTPHGRLMLTVLGELAEFERHLILARTTEGRIRAQARGVKFGRRAKLTRHQRAEALARRASGEACVDIARRYAVSHSTISRL